MDVKIPFERSFVFSLQRINRRRKNGMRRPRLQRNLPRNPRESQKRPNRPAVPRTHAVRIRKNERKKLHRSGTTTLDYLFLKLKTKSSALFRLLALGLINRT